MVSSGRWRSCAGVIDSGRACRSRGTVEVRLADGTTVWMCKTHARPYRDAADAD